MLRVSFVFPCHIRDRRPLSEIEARSLLGPASAWAGQVVFAVGFVGAVVGLPLEGAGFEHAGNALLEGRHKVPHYPGANRCSPMPPSICKAASTAVPWRSGRKVTVQRRPCDDLRINRFPCSTQPRVPPCLVSAQVSSTLTRRSGSRWRPWAGDLRQVPHPDPGAVHGATCHQMS